MQQLWLYHWLFVGKTDQRKLPGLPWEFLFCLWYTEFIVRVVVLYRPKSEHGTSVETFVAEFKHRHPAGKLELTDVDSREGIALISLYDVMQYPAIIALATDGSVQHLWEGKQLPLIDEVAYYTMGA